MVWMSKSEAAEALGISVPTLERRISAGELQIQQDSRTDIVLVAVEDHCDTIAGLGKQMRELKSICTDHRAKEVETARSMLSVIGDYRRTLAARVRQARISAWVGWSAAAAMGMVIAGGAWSYHQSTIAHQSDLLYLQMAHNDDLSKLQVDAERRQEKLNKQFEETCEQLKQEQRTIVMLRSEFDRVSAELAAASAECDRVYDERDRLVDERERIALERDRLMQDTRLTSGFWPRN